MVGRDTEAVTGTSDSAAPPRQRIPTWLREIWPAAAVSVATFSILLACAGRYGFHRDEFYIRESGRHLAWGYPDHPPLSPLLA